MKLITWNIQWCRGCDGRVDPRRIIEHARALADFDVLCLQEVAHNFPGLDGSSGEDLPGLMNPAGRPIHFAVELNFADESALGARKSACVLALQI